MDDDVALLLAEQADQIAKLTSALAEARDDYWSNVYDRVFDAWSAFALAELGTMSPSRLDLAGRPELLALYDAVK